MRITDTHIYFFTKQDIFSNFAYSPFIYEREIKSILGKDIQKIYFECSEQGFMFEKCMFFEQYEMAEKCIKETDPKKVKEIGRSIPNFDKDRWDKVSFDKMYNICYSKYNFNKIAREELLNTGDKILVEASPWDLIWGVGLSKNDDNILQEENWKGENRLGKVLMKIRKTIRNES
jgi:ribA/ribD-fused uncharacterized protein